MTTGGEGGMVTTNDPDLWSIMWSYKDHGKSWEAVYKREHPPGFRWLHESFGTNWRMLEVQATIGRIQLRRMKQWTTARRKNAEVIQRALAEFTKSGGPIRAPQLTCDFCQGCIASKGCRHAYYKYYAYVRPEFLSADWTRDRIITEISSMGVPCFHGSCSEVYLEKAFDNTNWRPSARLPVAKELGDTSLMFLVHPTIGKAEITKTAEVITEVLSCASL